MSPRGPAPRILGVLVVLAGLALVAQQTLPATGNSNGAGEYAEQGCFCHGENHRPGPDPVGSNGQPSADTTVTISGDLITAGTFEWGATYDVQLMVASTGVTRLPNAQNIAGFALSTTAGTLGSVDESTQLAATLTHTADGNDQDAWAFQWTAPAPGEVPPGGSVQLNASANVVNGDGANDLFDHWNQASVALTAPAAAPDEPATNNTTRTDTPDEDEASPTLALPLLLVAVATALCLARRH